MSFFAEHAEQKQKAEKCLCTGFASFLTLQALQGPISKNFYPLSACTLMAIVNVTRALCT